jgi:hypothetical protein
MKNLNSSSKKFIGFCFFFPCKYFQTTLGSTDSLVMHAKPKIKFEI